LERLHGTLTAEEERYVRTTQDRDNMGHGCIFYNGGLGDFYSLHAAMRTMIEVGKMAYLPRVTFDANLMGLKLPRIKRYGSDDPFYVARNAFAELYLDRLISERLGLPIRSTQESPSNLTPVCLSGQHRQTL
jgi:hypothetical protein